MAKKSNTLLIVGVIAVAAYLYLKPSTASAAVPNNLAATGGAPDPNTLAQLKNWEQGYLPNDPITFNATDAALNQMNAAEATTLLYIIINYFNGNKPIPASDPYAAAFNALKMKYHLFGG